MKNGAELNKIALDPNTVRVAVDATSQNIGVFKASFISIPVFSSSTELSPSISPIRENPFCSGFFTIVKREINATKTNKAANV